MNYIIYLSLFFLLINTIICIVPTNQSEENLPYAYQTPLWQKIFKQIEDQKGLLPFSYSYSGPELNAGLDLNVQCILCNVLIGTILTERSFDMTDIQLAAEIQYFCVLLKIEDERVCEGTIFLNVDSIGYIIDHKDVSSGRICGLIGLCNATNGDFEWTIDIPKGSQVAKRESTGDETFNIVHLTDIHYDPNYVSGKKLDCGEPLCCQKDQDNAQGDEEACGRYGGVKDADTPLELLKETIKEINKQDFDYVYFTGDLVSHRVWDTSTDFNSKIISDVMDLFDGFSKPVYPILGNHETNPVNVYAPLDIKEDRLSNQWLFDLIFEKWSKWLGEDVKETVTKGGYYTVSPRDGFRVIVLNNNVCQLENWWNIYDDYDPYGQLQWLAATLKKAEENEEVVHILTHIPNSHCLKVWGREYNKIVERFSNTIAAQFNGHTHRDQFHIFYDTATNPMSVVFNGGSLMPDRANPNYKIYTVDKEGFDVMDVKGYTFDLVEANKNNLKWYELYSYQKNFGIKKMIPSQLDALVTTMYEDISNKNYTLINDYHNFYFRNSRQGQSECDEDCQKRYLCEILTTVREETKKCKT